MMLLLLLLAVALVLARRRGGASPDEGEVGGQKSPPGSEFVTDPDEQITEHFNAREFLCRCGRCRETFRIHRRLVYLLEAVVRGPLGLPVVVTSGYRCPAHNATLKGASPRSYHLKGMAADVYVRGFDTRTDLATMLLVSWRRAGLGGLGLYDTICHVDTGEVRLWDKRSQ